MFPKLEPIAYEKRQNMKPSTIKEFNLTDQEAYYGLQTHKYNHIKTNIKLATAYNLLRIENCKFKRSPMNKIH